jgi:O-antigen/teichoic acid export membrane protein
VDADLPPSFSHLLRVSLPLALASASILLMNELDKVMLAAFRPEEEVGLYTAAFRIARQVILILPALNAAISPSVAPLLAAGKREELAELYRGLTRWSIAAGASAALLFITFGADFLRFFGPEYTAGTGILTVLSLGYFVVAVAGNAGIVLQFSGREKLELTNGLIVTALNVTLNCALIPAYGAPGAAFATLASLTLVATRRIVQVRRVLGVGTFDRGTARALLVAAVGTALAAAMHFVADRLGAPAPVRAMTVLAAMAGVWVVALRIKGVTAAEAALLRLPKDWIREPAVDSPAQEGAARDQGPGSDASRVAPAPATSRGPGSTPPESASAGRSSAPAHGSARSELHRPASTAGPARRRSRPENPPAPLGTPDP